MARKTHTSTQVKNRWNKAHYIKIGVNVPIDTAVKFREKCKETGIPQAAVLKDAIESFLDSDSTD